MAVDHYNTLGVIPTATASDLRAAYLKLARANHPDKFEGEARDRAELRMRQINEAWNVLGVTHKRREYDAANPGARPAGAAADGSSKRRGRSHFQAFDDDPITRNDVDLDATPIAGSRSVPRWIAFMPILFVVGGIVVVAFGTMVGAAGVLAVGLIFLVLGAVGFLLMPLLVMSRAERDPNL